MYSIFIMISKTTSKMQNAIHDEKNVHEVSFMRTLLLFRSVNVPSMSRTNIFVETDSSPSRLRRAAVLSKANFHLTWTSKCGKSSINDTHWNTIWKSKSITVPNISNLIYKYIYIYIYTWFSCYPMIGCFDFYWIHVRNSNIDWNEIRDWKN